MAWNEILLSKILTESKVEIENPNTKNRIRVKLNLGGVEQRPDSIDTEGATKYYKRKAGQFIYGKQNLHKGAFGIVPDHLDGYESSSDIPAFDVNPMCYPEWVFYFFKQGNLYSKLDFLAKGVGSKRIQTKDLLKISIPMPEREEQKLILNSIKEYESISKNLENEFDEQLKIIERTRIMILLDAIQGKLTNNFRQSTKSKLSGKNLFDSIKSQKVKYSKENKIKSDLPFPLITSKELPFKIPSTWIWCRYGDLIEPGTSVSYGVLIPGSHVPDGIPLIRVGDLDGAIEGVTPSKFIRKEISDKFKKTLLKGGELLIAVVGSNIGKVARVHEKWIGANIARAVSRTVVNSMVNTTFFEFVIRSKYIQEYFVQSSRSIGQPTLNINAITKAIIPIPPFEEQEIIVLKLNEIFENYLQLEEQIKSSIGNLLLLVQSFLIKSYKNYSLNLTEFGANTSNEITDDIQTKISFDYSGNEKKNINMELQDILAEYGKLSAVELWKLSKYEENIDDFYEELKTQIEIKKTIKESENKGFLELIS